jgi:NADPH:quinone reductase-like Zn-dependent oxidoreductase
MATKKRAPSSLVFVDDAGGGVAALAAGIARSLGHEAIAATSSAKIAVPAEVAVALKEIGAEAPPVVRLADVKPAPAKPTELGGWPVALVAGELERLSAVRIARDRLEKELGASLSASS